MRRAVVTAFITASLFTLVSAQADVFAKLGSNTTEAQEMIFSSFSSGGIYFAGTRQVFKTATTEAKVAMVTSIVNFARTYSTSADFLKRYGVYREGQKPDAPKAAMTGEQARAEQKKALQEGIANMEKAIKEVPSMKAAMEPTIAQFKQQLAEAGTNKAANAEQDQMFKQMGEMEATEYRERLAAWEKKYPVDPKRMVASRLREFLAMSATVDFAAKTAPSKDNPKMLKFANEDYEGKEGEWKYMFRAGKPAVDAARAIAQDWLKTLGG